MDIREMYLNDRKLHGRDRVPQRYRCVRIAARIHHDTVHRISRSGMEMIDQPAFVVGLREGKFDVGKLFGQPGFDVVKALPAVGVGLTRPEEIQVRTVQNEDFHGCSSR